MPHAKIVWNADKGGAPPQQRGLSASEIVQELARFDVGDDATDPVGWLIRCAKVVNWNEEPAYSAVQMRVAVDKTIDYLKWGILIGAAGGIVAGILIGALVL